MPLARTCVPRSTSIGAVTQGEDFRARVLVVDDDAVVVGDVVDRAAPGGLRRPPSWSAATTRHGGVPHLPARRRPARPDAAREGRHRRLPGDPGRVRRPDRDAHRQGRHRRRRGRPRVGCRRLRRQAVQAQGAGRPHPRPRTSQRRRPGPTRSPIGAAGDRRRRPLGDPRRRSRSTSPPSSSTCSSAWPASPGRCSPARCCSSRSGATVTRPTRGWSTSTSSGCGPRSSTDPENPEIVLTVRGVGYKAGSAGEQ